MRVRRLRWQNAARRRALLERLRTELKAWLEDWSVDPELLSLQLVDEGESLPTDQCWMEATSRNGSIFLRAAAGEFDGLGGLLARAARGDPLKLGSRIGHRALRALLTRFAGLAAGPVECGMSDEPSPDRLDPRFGCGLLALSGSGFDARLILDCALFEHWVPSPQRALPALVPGEIAVGSESVILNVMLDLGTGQLADTQGLRVGDVLVSNTSINSLFHLVLPDARRVVSAHLLRRGDRRALQIEASIPRKDP